MELEASSVGRCAIKRDELFAMYEKAADGVHIVGPDQKVLFWNSAASQILGHCSKDAQGKACYDLIAGGDYRGNTFCRSGCPTIQAVRRGRSIPNYDVLARPKDGNDIWINMSVLPVSDPDGEGMLAVHLFRDVSSRRRAEILAQRTLASVSEYRNENEGQLDEPSPPPAPLLTRRELDVLQLLACGMRDTEIAQSLEIKRTTVRNHVEHILGKLGVHSRLEAVVYAANHHMV